MNSQITVSAVSMSMPPSAMNIERLAMAPSTRLSPSTKRNVRLKCWFTLARASIVSTTSGDISCSSMSTALTSAVSIMGRRAYSTRTSRRPFRTL